MNLLHNTRRHLVVLAVAALIAITAAYAPIALDQMASTSLTPAAFACGHSGSGC